MSNNLVEELPKTEEQWADFIYEVSNYTDAEEKAAIVFPMIEHLQFSAAWSKAKLETAQNEIERLREQLVKRTEGLKRIERGATSVLLDASLNEDPINPDVLQEILKDISNALTDELRQTNPDDGLPTAADVRGILAPTSAKREGE